MSVQSDRDHLVDGLHTVLEQLWNGSDQVASSEFRKLIAWHARAVKPFVRTYVVGTFPAPGLEQSQDLNFLVCAAVGMRNIETAFSGGDSDLMARRVKDLLSFLSEPREA